MLIKRLGDYLAWLGGADQAVLAQVPSARARFVQMAGILLTTAGLAVASMSFALHDGLKVPWPPTVFLGLLWGFVILNIDRFLVLSMGSTRHRGRLLLMAAPRFAMAVVLALVISTPLVLRVFASDINAQLYTMQLERSKHQAALEASSKEQREANHLQQQISADVAVLDGHLPESVTSPELQAAQAKVTTLQGQEATAQHAMNVAYEAWVCELYGHQCYGASGVPGNGNLAQIKQQEYEQAAGAVNSIKSQLGGAISAENAAQNNVGAAKSADLATGAIQRACCVPPERICQRDDA
jgi:aerobic-type carbon monoxide dehydrogenase small subunit (CoxS/CutS family)